jgi:hypothetical protein
VASGETIELSDAVNQEMANGRKGHVVDRRVIQYSIEQATS